MKLAICCGNLQKLSRRISDGEARTRSSTAHVRLQQNTGRLLKYGEKSTEPHWRGASHAGPFETEKQAGIPKDNRRWLIVGSSNIGDTRLHNGRVRHCYGCPQYAAAYKQPTSRQRVVQSRRGPALTLTRTRSDPDCNRARAGRFERHPCEMAAPRLHWTGTRLWKGGLLAGRLRKAWHRRDRVRGVPVRRAKSPEISGASGGACHPLFRRATAQVWGCRRLACILAAIPSRRTMLRRRTFVRDA